MLLWRLSSARYAEAFDGGYGLLFDGRWNTVGAAVTYCSTSPSLCVLEKLVHIEDPRLMPAMTMVRYDVPDDLVIEAIDVADLPETWRAQESLTQNRGDQWCREFGSPLLRVPSVIVPLADSPDVNVLVNNRHPAATRIRISRMESFALDARLV